MLQRILCTGAYCSTLMCLDFLNNKLHTTHITSSVLSVAVQVFNASFYARLVVARGSLIITAPTQEIV